jgi:Cof subfamily protein (haloacid dehalogenase superfamily)
MGPSANIGVTVTPVAARPRQDGHVETPKLIASDVDGTLLNPMEGVTPRTAAVIARVLATGTPFVLASGRPPRWIPEVARAAGLHGHAVCSNGSALYDIGTDTVLAAHELAPELLHDIVHNLNQALPGCKLAVERLGESALTLSGREFATEHGYEHPWPGENVLATERAELLGQPAVKLLVRHSGMSSDELAAATEALIGDVANITYSSPVGMVEVSARGVTKGTGLAELAGRLGIAPADVIAFGDMPNDVPMLRWAGHGVAMANAHADVLSVADEVTATNAEDGVAQVLERWF